MDLPKRAISEIDLLSRPRRPHALEALEIAAANGGEGYVYYQDDAKRVRADALSIAADARTQVTIDGLGSGSLDDYLDSIPRPGTGKALLSSGSIVPIDEGDLYLLRFGFMAAMVDPGLSSTEESNSILIEYDVAGTFNVHQARTAFTQDPGPARARHGDLTPFESLTGVLLPIASLVAPRTTAALADLNTALAQHGSSGDGERFIEFGVFFAGPPVIADDVSLFVTPTVDIELWEPDITIARLSSPTA